jgi:serine/threonine-protein kinase
MITMKLIKLAAIPVIGLTVGLGLAACGSSTPTPAVTVTASSAPTTPAATTPAPAAPAQPAPVKTVYVQAPAAAPAPAPVLTDCGGGVYAGADTSCPFALNVAANYTGTGPDYAYSPVTGLSYTMNCSDSNPIICTGGDNALVQIGP